MILSFQEINSRRKQIMERYKHSIDYLEICADTTRQMTLAHRIDIWKCFHMILPLTVPTKGVSIPETLEQL